MVGGFEREKTASAFKSALDVWLHRERKSMHQEWQAAENQRLRAQEDQRTRRHSLPTLLQNSFSTPWGMMCPAADTADRASLITKEAMSMTDEDGVERWRI